MLTWEHLGVWRLANTEHCCPLTWAVKISSNNSSLDTSSSCCHLWAEFEVAAEEGDALPAGKSQRCSSIRLLCSFQSASKRSSSSLDSSEVRESLLECWWWGVTGDGNSDLWSSRRSPWHLERRSRKLSSIALSSTCTGGKEQASKCFAQLQ